MELGVDKGEHINSTCSESAPKNTVTRDSRPVKTCTCDVKIEGRPAVVLVDTGSAVTIVKAALINLRGQRGSEPSGVVLRSASGHVIPVFQEASLEFELSGERKRHKAFICPKLHYDAIIGFDFIKRNNIIIDAANETIWLSSGNRINLRHERNDEPRESIGLYLTKVEEHGLEAAQPETQQNRGRGRSRRMGSISNHAEAQDGRVRGNNDETRLEWTPAEQVRSRAAPADNRSDLTASRRRQIQQRRPEREDNERPEREGNERPEREDRVSSLPGRAATTEESHEGSHHLPERIRVQQQQDEGSEGSPMDQGVEEDSSAQQQRVDSLDTGKLEPEQRTQLLRLIDAHSKCFSWNGELGTCELIEHRIELTSNKPIRRPAYQVAQTQREFMEAEVRDMLQKGVIAPSVSPYAAGVVLVRKKSGEFRFCVDYRGLNEVTKPDHYPLPIAHNEIFDTLGEATIFSCLDCQQGYWQVKVAKEDRPKTAFRCFLGLFEFLKVPFGLRNAPATYQRLMSHVLSGYTGKFCHCFIDDIICFSKNFEDHLHHLQLIFERLTEAGIKLKPSKCTFAKDNVTYLGHQISVGELRPDSANVEKIRNLPAPETRREVRAFIGMASYYRCFVPDFSRRAKPLTDLTKVTTTFRWGPAQEAAFTDLKRVLTEAPVLALPDFSRPFILMTDGSSTGLGAVLGQATDGEKKERVIGYASRRTTSNEEKFSACELECLALVWAVKHFRTYILGRTVKVVTDHWALKWLLDLKSGNPRLQRWRMALQEYDLTITHKPGRLHRNADFLSRMYEDSGEERDEGKHRASGAGRSSDHLPHETSEAQQSGETCVTVAVESVSTNRERTDGGGHPFFTSCLPQETGLEDEEEAQESKGKDQPPTQEVGMDWQASRQEEDMDKGRQDVNTVQTRQQARRDTATAAGRPAEGRKAPPSEPLPGRQALKLQQEQDPDCIEIRDAVVNGKSLPKWAEGGEFRTAADGVLEKIDKDAIGTEMRKPLLPASLAKIAVADAHAGHLKVAKTLAKLKAKYFFKHMHTQCTKHIDGCQTCQEKDRGRRVKAPLGTLPKPWSAWHTVAVDVLGPLPQTRAGNKYVIIVTDYLTRFVLALAVRDQTAETTAEALMQKFLEYGFPERLITDNGPNFRSNLMEQLCSLLNISHLFTTPYHPQFDGLCERFNRTLASMLRGFVSTHQSDWDVHLPYVMYAYRTAVQESTKETPFFLMFGRQSKEPLDLLLRPEEDITHRALSRKPAMVVRMHTVFDHVQAQLQTEHARQKRYHDRGCKERAFEVGDEVMLLDERTPVGHTKKLHPPWKPGYRVIERIGPLNYKIEHPNRRGKILRVHLDRLKLQRPSHVWPADAREAAGEHGEPEAAADLTPLDRWLEEERQYRPFPDHWSCLDETETEEQGDSDEEPGIFQTPPTHRAGAGVIRARLDTLRQGRTAPTTATSENQGGTQSHPPPQAEEDAADAQEHPAGDVPSDKSPRQDRESPPATLDQDWAPPRSSLAEPGEAGNSIQDPTANRNVRQEGTLGHGRNSLRDALDANRGTPTTHLPRARRLRTTQPPEPPIVRRSERIRLRRERQN